MWLVPDQVCPWDYLSYENGSPTYFHPVCLWPHGHHVVFHDIEPDHPVGIRFTVLRASSPDSVGPPARSGEKI